TEFSGTLSKLSTPCPVEVGRRLAGTLTCAACDAAAVRAVCSARAPGSEKRLVLKSMISTLIPGPSVAGVIRSLSIVPVRIPSGRRKRNRNSLQRPGDDLGNSDLGNSDLGNSDLRNSDLRNSDLEFGIWNLESATVCAATMRRKTSLAR